MRSELCDGTDDGKALQLGGRIRFFTLAEGSGGAADDAFFAISDFSENCAETYGRRVRV